MSVVKLNHPTRSIKTRVVIPGSKSESNRALILQALSGNRLSITGLSNARDTQRLIQLLDSDDKTIDVLDAGTSMRFLTACYCAANKHKIITGTERMQQRPIAPLVNALREMGFDIRYLGQEGFPPLEIVPVNLERIANETFIEGNVSSQFITALLLIAPFLPNGLKVNFTTELTSRPYIEMTLKMLAHFGVQHHWAHHAISISKTELNNAEYKVGADWSSASYWYSIAFLASEAEIFLENLRDDWNQGDRVMADWMKRFGITTEFTNEGALVKKVNAEYTKVIKINFKDNPDLAQTFAGIFAGGGVYGTFSGIESLKIKETDRINALKTELNKMNIQFEYSDMYEFYQLKGHFQLPASPVQTYNDHRMAMSFAPLAMLGNIEIEQPEVVNKSYPGFWDDLRHAGFKVNLE
jgi:3-phosphoshikimate 1-carboxyvinyltransferase